MTLRTKCILKERTSEDGLRISVMSRHTKNDGVTRDERITRDLFDRHLPTLGPTGKLLGGYYKRGLSWVEFEARFRDEMQAVLAHILLSGIARLSLRKNVTLLCIEEDPHFCHRRLLAEECKRLSPDIVVEHH